MRDRIAAGAIGGRIEDRWHGRATRRAEEVEAEASDQPFEEALHGLEDQKPPSCPQRRLLQGREEIRDRQLAGPGPLDPGVFGGLQRARGDLFESLRRIAGLVAVIPESPPHAGRPLPAGPQPPVVGIFGRAGEGFLADRTFIEQPVQLRELGLVGFFRRAQAVDEGLSLLPELERLLFGLVAGLDGFALIEQCARQVADLTTLLIGRVRGEVP